jgi:hypothetical protein
VQISESARLKTQRPIPEDHRSKNPRLAVFMCFDETYIRSLQTYIFFFVSYSVLIFRKAHTQFDVRE